MAFEKGTATGATDLLGKLVAFAGDNGWTVNRNVSVSGREQNVSFEKNGVHLHFQATDGWSHRDDIYNDQGAPDGEINYVNNSVSSMLARVHLDAHSLAVCTSTGFDASKNWCNQPGAVKHGKFPAGSYISTITGIYAYYFFAHDETLFVVMQPGVSVCKILCAGRSKTFDGGDARFVYGHDWFPIQDGGQDRDTWGIFMHMQIGGSATIYQGRHVVVGETIYSGKPTANTIHAVLPNNMLSNASWIYNNTDVYKNALGFQHILSPVVLYHRSVDVIRSLMQIPFIRWANTSSANVGDEFGIGGDEWVLFPARPVNETVRACGVAILK